MTAKKKDTGQDGKAARGHADERAKEQQRVINRHRRQLSRLGGILTVAIKPQLDDRGDELPRTAQDCAALVRTAEQLHKMERVAQGIDDGKADAPSVILVPASALTMEAWHAGAPADAAPTLQAGPAPRPIEDDIQGTIEDLDDLPRDSH